MGNESDSQEPKRWQEFDAKGEGVKPHIADDTLTPSPEVSIDLDIDGGAVSFTVEETPPNQ